MRIKVRARMMEDSERWPAIVLFPALDIVVLGFAGHRGAHHRRRWIVLL